MPIKEKPLINAASNPDSVWSPGHPVFAGVWSVLAVAFFAALIVFFQAAGRGAVYPSEILMPIRFAVYASFVIGVVAALVVNGQANGFEHETAIAQKFACGVLGTMAAIILADIVFGPSLSRWAETAPSFHGMAN